MWIIEDRATMYFKSKDRIIKSGTMIADIIIKKDRIGINLFIKYKNLNDNFNIPIEANFNIILAKTIDLGPEALT